MSASSAAAASVPSDVDNAPGFKEKVKLVFVSYGSRELEQRRGGGRGGFGGDPRENTEALKEAGINSHFYVSPDTAHEWQSWRRSLREFAPLLFQEQPATSTAQGPPKPSAPAAAPVATTVRIKAGQFTPFTDSKGQVWSPDQGFEGGDTIDRDPNTEIAGTKDPELFLAERYSMNSFSCKLANGKYLAKLYFAKHSRVLPVRASACSPTACRDSEFKDFDIWAKAGGPNRAYIETVPVEVTDGEFRIIFTSQIENPEINAIEIIPQTDPAAGAGAAPPMTDAGAAVQDEPERPAPRRSRRGGRGGFGGQITLGPDDKPAFDDPPAEFNVARDDIPHGKLEMIQYDSKTVGTSRNMNVYTPPGYSAG